MARLFTENGMQFKYFEPSAQDFVQIDFSGINNTRKRAEPSDSPFKLKKIKEIQSVD